MEEGNCDSLGLSWMVVLEEEEEEDGDGDDDDGGGGGGGLHLCWFVFVNNLLM